MGSSVVAITAEVAHFHIRKLTVPGWMSLVQTLRQTAEQTVVLSEVVGEAAAVAGEIPHPLHHLAWWVEHTDLEPRPLWVRSSGAACWV